MFSFIPKPQLSFFEPCNIFFHLNSVPKWKCFTLYALCEKKYVCIIEYKAIHTCILFVYMFNAGLIQNLIILARMQTKLFIFHTIKRSPKMFGIKRIKLCWNIYKHVHVLNVNTCTCDQKKITLNLSFLYTLNKLQNFLVLNQLRTNWLNFYFTVYV